MKQKQLSIENIRETSGTQTRIIDHLPLIERIGGGD